jgi:hypothetical protein
MLPPRMTTPMSKRLHTPMSEKKTPLSNRTLMMTPSNDSGREARASIIQIRNQNAGQVAQKARLFDNLSTTENLLKSAEQPIIKLPRVVINKSLENVRNMTSAHNVPSNRRQSNSPRRSSRSPGVNRRLQLRVATQSPVLKTIKENKNEHHRATKINLLKNSEALQEIASPRTRALDNRKVLSQNNTPRRASSRTPTSGKKTRTPRRNTPTAPKSPRHFSRRAHEIIFD